MEAQTQTEFNSNAAVLERLNNYILIANNLAEMDDLTGWFRQLEKVRRDVLIKMKHKKAKTECVKSCVKCVCEKKFKKLKETRKVFDNNRKQCNVADYFKDLLDDYQIFLMDFMNSKGMMLRDENTDFEIPDEW